MSWWLKFDDWVVFKNISEYFRDSDIAIIKVKMIFKYFNFYNLICIIPVFVRTLMLHATSTHSCINKAKFH